MVDYEQHGEAPESECDMACAGASDEACGGYDRMSVWSYRTTSVTDTDFTCDGIQRGDFCCSACGGYDRMSVWTYRTTSVTDTDFTCDGIQRGDFCCSVGGVFPYNERFLVGGWVCSARFGVSPNQTAPLLKTMVVLGGLWWTTSVTDTDFTCDGIQRGDFCCSVGGVFPYNERFLVGGWAGCGECGGEGCSNRGEGLDGDDCCQSNIEDNGNMCSVTGKAPCMID
ncbi:unnamed protein product [Ectocarpus sp. CCAP 1310/34]|nr:unnamed protein product [Ectocarpus sp. CCAP 1310/34]